MPPKKRTRGPDRQPRTRRRRGEYYESSIPVPSRQEPTTPSPEAEPLLLSAEENLQTVADRSDDAYFDSVVDEHWDAFFEDGVGRLDGPSPEKSGKDCAGGGAEKEYEDGGNDEEGDSHISQRRNSSDDARDYSPSPDCVEFDEPVSFQTATGTGGYTPEGEDEHSVRGSAEEEADDDGNDDHGDIRRSTSRNIFDSAPEFSNSAVDNEPVVGPHVSQLPTVSGTGAGASLEEDVAELGGVFGAELGAETHGPENSLQEGPTRKDDGAKVDNFLKLFSLLLGTGSKRMTRVNYQSMINVVAFTAALSANGSLPRWNADAEEVAAVCGLNSAGKLVDPLLGRRGVLPSSKTIGRFANEMIKSLTAECSIIRTPVDILKAGARVTARQGLPAGGEDLLMEDESDHVPTAEVIVVLPSEYALLDLATAPIHAGMVDLSRSGVDEIPIVRRSRRMAYGPEASLYFTAQPGGNPGSAPKRAYVGSQVAFQVAAQGAPCVSGPWNAFWSSHVGTSAGEEQFPQLPACFRGHFQTVFQVNGASSWESAHEQASLRADAIGRMVSGETTAEDDSCGLVMSYTPGTSTQDLKLSALLSVASHTHVLGPPPRTGRRSRGCCIEPKSMNEVAPIRPGDKLALLSPHDPISSSSSDLSSHSARLLVVERFLNMEGEAERLVTAIHDPEKFVTALQSERAGANSCIYGHSTAPENRVAPTENGDLHFFVPYASSSGRPNTLLGPHLPVTTFHVKPHSSGGGPECMISFDADGCRPESPTENETDDCRFAPSYGRLGADRGNEPYIIYRMVLYHDGFKSSEGKSVSSEGIYILPLNIPRDMRQGSPAVRVVACTPPGSDVLTVLDRVLENIYVGTTTGFLGVAADGTLVRVFLDLVAWIADTPAANQLLDVMGHTAGAPCHVCVFRRLEKTDYGGRYTSTTCSGASSKEMRTLAHHAAARSVLEILPVPSATGERCKCEIPIRTAQIGIKTVFPEGSRAMRDMPLHLFCEKLEKAARSGAIPRDATGRRLLSGYLNPYRALAIAPDHLLTGIFLKAVEATLKMMLPAQRCAANAFFITHLGATGLDAQSDVVNVDKGSLHSMTLSEAYALSIIAVPALLAGVLSPETTATDHAAENERRRRLVDPRVTKIMAALECVASAADVIGTFWTPSNYIVERYKALSTSVPDIHSDHSAAESMGAVDASVVQARALEEHATFVSGKVRHHLAVLERVFTGKPQQGSHMPEVIPGNRLEADAEKARNAADVPNVHRLLEMCDIFLQDFLHGDFLAELAFEAKHQPLKRGIQRSNRHKAHIIAMKAEALNDWEGRLAALYEGATEGEDNYVRGCIRLLQGRLALARSALQTVNVGGTGNASPARAVISQEDRNAVMCALGPEGLVSSQLVSNARQVFSKNTSCDTQVRFYRPRRILDNGEAGVVEFDPVVAGPLLRVFQLRSEEVCTTFPSRAMQSVACFADNFRSHLSGPSPAGGSTSTVIDKEVMVFYKCASWKVRSRQTSTPGESSIGAGDIIRIHPASGVGAEDAFSHSQSSSGLSDDGATKRVWCVLGLASNEPGTCGKSAKLVLRPCEQVPVQFEGYHPQAMRVNFEGAMQSAVIPLEPTVIRCIERVAVIPDCSSLIPGSRCCAVPPSATGIWKIRHAAECQPLGGGSFYVRDCSSGFPPRQA